MKRGFISLVVVMEVMFAALSYSSDEVRAADLVPGPIDHCGLLNDPSAPYVLTQDINVTGTCFTIVLFGVTLDGGGFTITGDGSGIPNSATPVRTKRSPIWWLTPQEIPIWLDLPEARFSRARPRALLETRG